MKYNPLYFERYNIQKHRVFSYHYQLLDPKIRNILLTDQLEMQILDVGKV